MRFFLILACCFFSLMAGAKFKGVDVTEKDEESEARFKNDILRSEFCCDREYTSDWAQGLSQEESQRIVNKTLASQDSIPTPSPRRKKPPAGSGQR